MVVGAHLISCGFKNYKDNFIKTFSRVYGLILSEENKGFCKKLGDIRGPLNNPWCVEWGFNIVRFLR